MSDGFDKLKEVGAQAIHEKTHITREHVQAILHDSFEGMNKVQFLGFISILERDYAVNLNDLKIRGLDYFLNITSKNQQNSSVFIETKSKAKNTPYIIMALLVLVITAFFIFNKVEIKPGKPTNFGKIGNTFILNLPGNPLAAALNFELFAQSIILALSGDNSKYLNSINSKMKADYKLRAGKKTLVPGNYDGEFFLACDKFAPGMVSPLATSNSYIIIDEACSGLTSGDYVKVIPTRFSFTSKEKVDLVSKS